MKLLTFQFSKVFLLLLIVKILLISFILYTDFSTLYAPVKILMIVLVCTSLILILYIIHYDIRPLRFYKLKKYAIIKGNYDNYIVYYKYFLFYSKAEITYSWQRNDDEKDSLGKPKNYNSFAKMENVKKCIERLKHLDEECFNKIYNETTEKLVSVYKE